MSSLHQFKLSPPSDWQEFQRMTYDLYKELWNNGYIQEFGRLGQRQFGVDVFGYLNKKNGFYGIQCKCVSKLSPRDVKKEYENSKSFQPKLSRFIITTTAKRDGKVQQKAAEITLNDLYPCEIVFWEDFCRFLSEHIKVMKKYYSEFFIYKSKYDSPGKLVIIDIDVNHYELLISRISEKNDYYRGAILVSDLQSRKCITYRMGGHWSRLNGIVGVTECDAFLISKWLNSFKNIDLLLEMGNSVMSYELSIKDKREAKKNGFLLIKR